MFTERTNKARLPDISQFVSELNESFSIIMDLEQLKDNFSARLRELFDTKEVYIFLLNPDLNRFLPVDKISYSDKDGDVPVFFSSDKLIFWLSVNKTFLNIEETPSVLSFLSTREQELLNHLNIRLIYPFIVMNQVRGMVCIGQRNAGEYIKYEIRQLKIFLDQAGFAFENALLYQLQKDRTRKMYRADKLATLGELAAGAAHEIRNPLTSIRSSIQYLKRKLKDTSDIEMADDLISEVDRIDEIIEGMLSFSKPRLPKKENTNLRQLLYQTVQLISNTAHKKGIEIKLNYQSINEEIETDASQLKQVFLNIIMNSMQAITKEKGSIEITVNEISNSKNYGREAITYIVEIADDGKGIEPEIIDKIFDPFFTTRSEGTGLGLSICYGIVNRHGGDIELFSNPGKGTIVKIKIPKN